jgi:ubiquinone/menaquinone biosynthesis C-methylase UbiE
MIAAERRENVQLDSNAEWKQWGLDDPFWAVSSWDDKQKGGDKAWTQEELSALGESDFRDYFSHWQQYGVNLETCLEIGCGVGRVTRQLDRVFGKVFAVDVSEEMIGHARQVVSGRVEFSLIDGLNLPYEDGSIASVFSTFVLQHLDDVSIGFAYFREFARVLKPGGTFMVQVPLYSFPAMPGPMGKIMRGLHRMSRKLGTLWAGFQRRRGVKIMRLTPYSAAELQSALASAGFVNVQFRMFPIRSHGEPFWCVFGTKGIQNS